MRQQLNILGIAGSPRAGGTEILLREALAAAAKTGGISTETVLLRKEEINYCTGCFRCSESSDGGSGCRVHADSMDRITDLLVACHGLILATPVYFGAVTAQMKTFMDRTEPLLRYAPGPLHCALRNKVGAAIALAQNRSGGQEATIQGLHHFFFIHDMMVVGTGPDERPGCYTGVSGFSGIVGEEKETAVTAVKSDEIGIRAARILGRRMAEAVKIVFPSDRPSVA